MPQLQQQRNAALQESYCPLAEKRWSGCFVYHALVDRSDINQIKNYYGTGEKVSKRVTTATNLLLEIKVRKKYRALKSYLAVGK